MTPIEKNIRVIDDKGNELEPTYPKRAKGLVKNGRARFVDENTICLACPPLYETEEITMANNTITKKDVFDQIVALQKDMGSIEQILFKVQCVSDSQRSVEPEDGEPVLLDYMPEVALQKINAIREIVMNRQHTINTILEYYLSVYQSLTESEA